MNSRPLAELVDIHLQRGETRVFDGLSLRLDFGENTAILGPNGAGKTSLLKLFASEIHPLVREGSFVRLMGMERWNVWDLRHHLGLLSQDLQNDYDPEIAGLDIVLSGLYSSIGTYAHQSFSKAAITRARKLIRELGIEGLEGKCYGHMSTGQQRRFLLTRTLIHNPEALILDEPTTGLDLEATIHYLQLMRSLIRGGKTLILVTHHLHEIPPEIGRVVLLKEGRIVADGPKQEVLTSAIISDLYEVPIRLVEESGWYQAVPDEA
jgi:iron complex transport system ATP-binding protein